MDVHELGSFTGLLVSYRGVGAMKAQLVNSGYINVFWAYRPTDHKKYLISVLIVLSILLSF